MQYVKCGFSGENFPTSVFPCVVGRPMLRYEESLTEQEVKVIQTQYLTVKPYYKRLLLLLQDFIIIIIIYNDDGDLDDCDDLMKLDWLFVLCLGYCCWRKLCRVAASA